jgi:hypothetical protein
LFTWHEGGFIGRYLRWRADIPEQISVSDKGEVIGITPFGIDNLSEEMRSFGRSIRTG